jgi:hypothetical protein
VKGPKEQDLVNACLQLLALRNVFAWRNNSGAFVLGEGAARRFFRAGKVGGSDVLAVLPPAGQLLAIECKRPGGKGPTAAQAAFLDSVRAAGGEAAVIRDVAELVQLLDGLQRPALGGLG